MNEISIESLRVLCKDIDNIAVTQHTAYRFQQRDIQLNDVISAIINGEIIEQYQDDYPYPSCLVSGFSTKGVHLHTVCAIGVNKLWLITAYFPTLDKWESDYKTRKAVE